MPEGPEIRRAADTVSDALVGRKTLEVRFAAEHLERYEEQLTGLKVIAVDTRGKAMLTRFENGLAIYSHNQLYGRWHTGPTYVYPETKRQLRLAIHNRKMSALLYSASEIDVLTPDEVTTHPFLSRLGPDVLSNRTTAELILSRLCDKRFHRRRLGNILTDQSFVAGLGNYLRCEILFIVGIHPELRPFDCTNQQLRELSEVIITLPRQSYTTRGITNDLDQAKGMISKGSSFEDARFYLFRRDGKPCYHCGRLIIKSSTGGQACYTCPNCQSK